MICHLEALILAKPRATVLVDWQRQGQEGHFQYGAVGFDLFEHLFARTARCRSLGRQDLQRRAFDFSKRVNILFMNMLRGLIWGVPAKDFQALREGYHRAMKGALQPSPLMSRRVREVTETWPEGARVVGVHKRLGTNEVAACQLAQRNPPPLEYLAAAKAILAQTPPGVPQVLYLATDEVQTAEAFRKELPPGSKIQLCCREGVKRSRGGVRSDGIDNEVHRSPCRETDAEDALVDALCLSKCTDLVCIDSNLSIFVSMLNPQIRIRAMSHAVPPGWEEKAAYPSVAVFSSYRITWSMDVVKALSLGRENEHPAFSAPRTLPLKKKVVVSGAGPAGLLAARSILQHRPGVELRIYEKRGDPRVEPTSGFRAYSLGLNIRGRKSLQHWPGLWEQVAQKGVLSDKFLLHVGGFQLQLRGNQPGSVPTLLLGRQDLCAALLEDLEQRFGDRLHMHFGESLEKVDLDGRRCVSSAGSTASYEDLIGADGVNSVVRRAMEGREGFRSEAVDLPGEFKVWVGPCPQSLEPLAVHAMASGEYSLFSIPRQDGRLCTILSWNKDPPSFLSDSDEQIATRVEKDFPSFGRPALEAVAQLRKQRASSATTVRANRYHDLAGRALLLGDAAHSTGGTLGQGANSALQDAVVLDRLLEQASQEGSVVQELGEEFSRRQQPEGLALWKLLQLPPKGPLSLAYLASQGLQGLLSRLSAAPRPVQSLLSETTTPYTAIIEANRFWLDQALKDAPGTDVSQFALPSTASEIVGQAVYDQVVAATGRYWEGWVELVSGGWVRPQGGNSGCWAMEPLPDGMVSMRRVSQGELLIPEGPRLPRKRRPNEPLPSACCQAQTSSYCASTSLRMRRISAPRVRRKAT
ncbi:unnamed protein product [Effrenium voratum]|nr:unnamed protein product [Effrenium voratum]